MIILAIISSQKEDLVHILNFNLFKYIPQLVPSVTDVRAKCMLILSLETDKSSLINLLLLVILK